jgi:hypothetical protein
MEGAGGRGGVHVEMKADVNRSGASFERHTQVQQGEYQMKHNVMLTVASLLSILLLTLHLTDDIIRGMEKGGAATLVAIPILVVWLFGTLVLTERRSGYIIILLGSILASGMPVIHMRGAGVGGAVAKSSGAFFFVWTLLALGVTGLFSVLLSVRGLWSLRRTRPRLSTEGAGQRSGAMATARRNEATSRQLKE